MNLTDILAAFNATDDDVRANGWRALCPVHEADGSHSPSLIVDYNADTKRVLVKCQSRSCAYEDILLAAKLTPGDMTSPQNVGHAARAIHGTGVKTPVGDGTKGEAGIKAYAAAVALARRVAEEPNGDVAERLCSYGINPDGLTSTTAEALGVGLGILRLGDERARPGDAEWVTIVARDASGMVAWAQSRNPDPDAELRYLGMKNPSNGSWSTVGFVGQRGHLGPVVICEGASDSLVVAALDRYDVIGVRGAGNASNIMELSAELVGRDVVIAFDADESGKNATVKMLNLLSPLTKSVAYMKLPEGTDVRDMLGDDPAIFAGRFADAVEAARVYVPKVDFDYAAFVKGAGEINPKRVTDTARAMAVRAYAQARGFDIAYTGGLGWLAFDGTVWRTDAEHVVWQLSASLGRHVRDTVADEEMAAHWSEPFLNASPTTALVRALGTLPGVRTAEQDWDAHPELLGVGNGVVHISASGIELRPMKPEYRITRRLAVEYRPDAKASRWEQFLAEVLIDDEGNPAPGMVESVRQMLGQGVTGWREQIFAVLVGKGANGKSVLLDVLSDVFGAIHERTSSATFERVQAGKIRSDLAALKGARLVTASESNQGARFDEGLIKTATGDKLIKGEFKFKQEFEFRPEFLLMIATNHAPEFRGKDDGLWRRVKRINFLRQFKDHEQDRSLADKLATDESEGILAWVLAGAVTWLANGRAVKWSRHIEAATAEYRADSDVDAEFIEINLVRTDDAKDVVLLDSLYERAREWWEADGTPPSDRPGRTIFARQLEGGQLGPRVTGGSSNARSQGGKPIRWRGWRLRSAVEVKARYEQARRDLGVIDAELRISDADTRASTYEAKNPNERARPLSTVRIFETDPA